MKRIFTEEEKEKLLKYVDQDQEKNDSRFLGGFIDWGADILHYGGLDISTYVDDIDIYHKKLIDKEDYTRSSIKDLFEAVYSVDSTYKQKFNDQLELLKNYENTLVQLNSVIEVKETENGQSSVFRDPSIFSNSLKTVGNGAVDYYLAQYMSVNENGEQEINWSALEEFFKRNVDEIDPLEYVAIMNLLDTFVTEENGEFVIDTEKMERFIECAYSYQPDTQNTTVYMTATLSPVFIQLTAEQEERAYLLLSSFGQSFYSDVDEGGLGIYINEELMKTGLMSACVQNLSIITNYERIHMSSSEDIDEIYNWKVSIDISAKIEEDTSRHYYFLGVTDGYIQDMVYEGAEIHGFSNSFNGIGHDNKIELATSLYEDIGEKIKADVGEQIATMALGSVIDKLDVACPGMDFFVTEGISVTEAERQNDIAGKIIHTENTQYYADVLCIGGCVNLFNGDMQVNFQYCCKEKLSENIARYNADSANSEHQVEMEALLDDYNEVLKGNEPSENLKWFAKWINNYKYKE
ncbi:hypothetical protein [Roseburia sp. 499]|uniref:hypothetical protein n=1 Tax=Roseburia sp. 499 TaxID=1261634 RepID=UPI000952F934|nr:hypothetical protein [Roseburia sp. 499]WVK69814.1 hypothetical protein BIV20_15980 [Roseburia sp. 499]